MAYDSQIIRIKTDASSVFNSIADIVTGGPITIYSGNTVDIQLGLFNDGAVASTVGFATAVMEIKPRNADGTVPDEGDASYASKTITSFSTTVTVANWKARTDQHMVFSFTDTEMKIPDGNHWLSCYVITSGGDTIVLLAGDFVVKNPGTDAGTPTYVDLGPSYYTAVQSDARYIRLPASPTDNQVLTYDSGTSAWVAETSVAGSMNNVVEDITPQLGGSLDVNGQQIISLSTVDIKLHSNDDIILELGDAAGVKKVSVTDSASVEVASINSDGGVTCTSASISGNITVTGTVDGRDVSTDGTKLDGIEAAADVTDATNVAAASAVMDADFSTDGVMIRTASGTYTNRTISGTTDQIVVTDGDGVSANPYISLASNVILPGVGRVKIPVGTTAERPAVGTEGDLRGNSSTNNIEYYDGFDWVDITAGASGGIAAVQDDTSPKLGNYLDTNAFDIYMDNSTGIKDEIGNEQLQFITTGSAVNYIRLTNSATGNAPAFVAAGDDTNINLSLGGKGTGRTTVTGHLGFSTTKGIVDGNGNEEVLFTTTTSAVNYLNITNSVTAAGPIVAAAGDDTNVDLRINTKGTGVIKLENTTAITGVLTLDQGSTSSGEIRLSEDSDNGSNYLAIKAPSAVTTTTTWTLPNGDGSSDQVLKTNGSGTLSWTTPSTTQNWEIISTATASASSSIDFTSLSSTYFMYMVVMENMLPATDSTNLYIRTDANGGTSFDAGASDYQYANNFVNSSGTQSGTGSTGAAQIDCSGQTSNVSGRYIEGVFRIINPSAATLSTTIDWNIAKWTAAGVYNAVNGTGIRVSNTVDAIRFIMSSGNITSGVFKLYGLRA